MILLFEPIVLFFKFVNLIFNSIILSLKYFFHLFIVSGELLYTQEITFSTYTKNSLKVFLSDCFLFSAIFCFPRCFDMKIMSAARLLHLHLLQHKCVHHYKVAQASSHHEQMKNLMASKIFMLPVKNRKFQCINHSADCINDSAC